MPILWYVSDGPRPGNTHGEGSEVTFEELITALSGNRVRFLGVDPPAFNVATKPGRLEHVVVEVRDTDGVRSPYGKLGFYVIEGLRPAQSELLFARSVSNKQ